MFAFCQEEPLWVTLIRVPNSLMAYEVLAVPDRSLEACVIPLWNHLMGHLMWRD